MAVRRGPLLAQTVLILAGLLACGCQTSNIAFSAVAEPELRRRAVQLLLRATQSDDVEVACNATEALVRVAPAQGLPYFRSSLRSEYPLVRFAGLVALGTLRDNVSRSEICSLLADESQLVRLAAAFAAYRCGAKQYAQVLVTALHDHPDENVRAEAAHLIGLLDEPRALKRLRVAEQVPANERCQAHLDTALHIHARLGDRTALQEADCDYLLAGGRHEPHPGIAGAGGTGCAGVA